MPNVKKLAPILFIIVGLLWMTLGIVGESGRVAKLVIGVTFLGLGLALNAKKQTE